MKLTQNYLQALINEPKRNLGVEVDFQSQLEDTRPRTAKVPSVSMLNIDRPQTSNGFHAN
jgi:hypothetical protein